MTTSKIARDFLGSADRWPGGVDANGFPLINQQNDDAITQRMAERRAENEARYARIRKFLPEYQS